LKLNKKIKIVIAIAMIPIIIYLWPSALGGDTEFLLVQGNSMLGTIEPGSFVITKEKEKYEVDDIISYRGAKQSAFQGRTVVHRIVDETDKGFFILRGDNNPKNDPGIVTPNMINGEVVFFTPFIGYLLVIMRNPLVMGVLAVVMLMAQFKKKKKKKTGQPELEVKKKPKKKKKNNYILFVPALVINLTTYLLIQISFEAGIDEPKADPFTTFLYTLSDPYIASTISFALYFVLILGLYYYAKTHDTIPRRMLPSGGVITIKKKTNYVVASARLVWLMFILSGIFFLFTMFQELRSEIG
jgi:signal peptidase I